MALQPLVRTGSAAFAVKVHSILPVDALHKDPVAQIRLVREQTTTT